MVGWYHWLDGHEFEHALRVGCEQGSLHAAVHGIAKSQTLLSNWTEYQSPFIESSVFSSIWFSAIGSEWKCNGKIDDITISSLSKE